MIPDPPPPTLVDDLAHTLAQKGSDRFLAQRPPGLFDLLHIAHALVSYLVRREKPETELVLKEQLVTAGKQSAT